MAFTPRRSIPAASSWLNERRMNRTALTMFHDSSTRCDRVNSSIAEYVGDAMLIPSPTLKTFTESESNASCVQLLRKIRITNRKRGGLPGRESRQSFPERHQGRGRGKANRADRRSRRGQIRNARDSVLGVARCRRACTDDR